MKVLPFDPFVESADIKINFFTGDECNVRIPVVPMEEVLKESDFISFHVPGGEVLGKDEFGILKKGVGIINTSRGGVVNEEALLEALESGIVSFAALDVFTGEPNPNPALLNHPKISVTPHIGAATGEAQTRIGIEMAEKIIHFFETHEE